MHNRQQDGIMLPTVRLESLMLSGLNKELALADCKADNEAAHAPN